MVAHLQADKPVYQSLKFVKTADFSNLGEAPGRYNRQELSETSVGRFNVSVALVQDHGGKYGHTLMESMDNKKPEIASSAI